MCHGFVHYKDVKGNNLDPFAMNDAQNKNYKLHHKT